MIDEDELLKIEAEASAAAIYSDARGRLSARITQLTACVRELAEDAAAGRQLTAVKAAADAARGPDGSALQEKYRRYPPPAFDAAEVLEAVLFALNANGVIAWSGDGVSIVVQMIEMQARRVAELEAVIAFNNSLRTRSPS